jgi:hypothetical protein
VSDNILAVTGPKVAMGFAWIRCESLPGSGNTAHNAAALYYIPLSHQMSFVYTLIYFSEMSPNRPGIKVTIDWTRWFTVTSDPD